MIGMMSLYLRRQSAGKITEPRTGVVSDRFSETGPAVGLEAVFWSAVRT